MDNLLFSRPIPNSPYAYPARHRELDGQGQSTQRIVESRRNAEFLTPMPKPRRQRGAAAQAELLFDELSTREQQYHASIINGVRAEVDGWREYFDVKTFQEASA
jgi:type III restriction enzyme